MADRDDRTLLLSRLSLRQLQILSTVAEHGSILHATRSMNMTQPAVSRAVMEIERIAGQPLFARSPRGVSPTPAGEVFVPHALPLIHLSEPTRPAEISYSVFRS